MSRAPRLDSFKDEIHRLLKNDPPLLGQRVRELIVPGFAGSNTIVDDYLREVRPLFRPARFDALAWTWPGPNAIARAPCLSGDELGLAVARKRLAELAAGREVELLEHVPEVGFDCLGETNWA